VSRLARCGDGADLQRWSTWSPLISGSARSGGTSVHRSKFLRSGISLAPPKLSVQMLNIGPECAIGLQGNLSYYISHMRRGKSRCSMRPQFLGPI
jgi:hypothetical protein